MTTERVKKDKNYSVISNEPINDARLSWGARGLLVYLLSKPDDWKVNIFDLIQRGPAREKRIRAHLKELVKFGYMVRLRFVRPDGTFNWVTMIYESPSLNPKISTISPWRTSGSRTRGARTRAKRSHILSTESPSTEELSTEESSTEQQQEEQAVAVEKTDFSSSATTIRGSSEDLPDSNPKKSESESGNIGMRGSILPTLKPQPKQKEKPKRRFRTEQEDDQIRAILAKAKAKGEGKKREE
jgi:hypothetical protein